MILRLIRLHQEGPHTSHHKGHSLDISHFGTCHSIAGQNTESSADWWSGFEMFAEMKVSLPSKHQKVIFNLNRHLIPIPRGNDRCFTWPPIWTHTCVRSWRNDEEFIQSNTSLSRRKNPERCTCLAFSSNSHNFHTSKGHEGGSTPTP